MSEHPPTTLTHREQAWQAYRDATWSRPIPRLDHAFDAGYDAALALAADLAAALEGLLDTGQPHRVDPETKSVVSNRAMGVGLHALAAYRAAIRQHAAVISTEQEARRLLAREQTTKGAAK